MNTKTEVWKDIPGYNGLYQVSSYGRVKSLCRGKELILKQRYDKDKYLRVNLFRDGKCTTFTVHILVLLAHVGPCPEGLESLHADHDRTNNRLSNLRYDTHKENVWESVRRRENPFQLQLPINCYV